MDNRVWCIGLAVLAAMFLVPSAQALAATDCNDTCLVIGDSTDTLVDYTFEEITFYAIYLNTSQNLTGEAIAGADCVMSRTTEGYGYDYNADTWEEEWTGWEAMEYDSEKDHYRLTEEFTHPGTYQYRINCSAEGFESLNLSDTFLVTKPSLEDSVWVHGLDADGESIRAAVENTGEWKQVIRYTILVDGEEAGSGELTLEEGEDATVETGYAFDDGTSGDKYWIKVEAETLYSAKDSQSMEKIVKAKYSCYNPLGMEGLEMCDYENKRVMVCSEGDWEVSERDYCTSCGDHPYCTLEQNQMTWEGMNDNCESEIAVFDYTNHLVEGGEAGTATVTVENRGDKEAEYTLALYLDGEFCKKKLIIVGKGESITEEFTYSAGAGTHAFEARLYNTACGTVDSTGGLTLTVYPDGSESWAETSPAEERLDTQVSIAPEALDIALDKAGAVALRVTSSRHQMFSIEVEGMPEGWLSHHLEMEVERKETSYIYITPRELGSYELKVSVKALDEGKEFTKTIQVFVGEEEKEETWFTNTTGTVKAAFGYVLGDPAMAYSLMIVVFLILLGAGFNHLKEPGIWE